MKIGALPPGRWIRMKPPPPILPASGHATARAKAVATAASTEFPPDRRTARPASAPAGATHTTTPCVQVTVDGRGGRPASATADPATRKTAAQKAVARMGDPRQQV